MNFNCFKTKSKLVPFRETCLLILRQIRKIKSNETSFTAQLSGRAVQSTQETGTKNLYSLGRQLELQWNYGRLGNSDISKLRSQIPIQCSRIVSMPSIVGFQNIGYGPGSMSFEHLP